MIAPEKWPRWLSTVTAVAIVAVVGLADYRTGHELLFSTLYLAAVALAAWTSGRAFAVVSSVSSVAAWLAGDLAAGARGHRMKREAPRTVVAAIRAVRAGGLYLGERVATRLAERFITGGAAPPESPVAQLSDRGLEVFRQMGKGRATRQIAESLRVSPKTVQARPARIEEKLGLANVTELLRAAVRWVESETAR